MADLEKSDYKVEDGYPDSDGVVDVRKGSVTEAADIYGDEEKAERKSTFVLSHNGCCHACSEADSGVGQNMAMSNEA